MISNTDPYCDIFDEFFGACVEGYLSNSVIFLIGE